MLAYFVFMHVQRNVLLDARLEGLRTNLDKQTLRVSPSAHQLLSELHVFSVESQR